MMRVGIGFDAHRFGRDRKLILGGVEIEHEEGLAGHSDADVLCHAIIDALLGAAARGDIGEHFPDTDPTWRDASSIELLKRTRKIVADGGCSIGNIDVTVIAERPKLAAYRDSMRANLAEALAIGVDRVSVKATTVEAMGALGRREGIAAMATAVLDAAHES